MLELEKTAISPVTRKRFRVDEFRKMVEVGILPEEHGWEIIDGYVIDKMSIGSKHTSTVKRLNRKFNKMFGDDLVISIQDPIHLDDFNEPEPDLALLKPRPDFYSESHPLPTDVLLLIEVSDSTLEYDREIKKMLYAEAEIAEFWLVNLKDNTIEIYSSPKNGKYRLARIVESGEMINSSVIENLTLEVDEILG